MALAPALGSAQVTQAAETPTPGSTPHAIDTTLAAVPGSAGVAAMQITEGVTLTISVKAVAIGRLDMASAPLILPFLAPGHARYPVPIDACRAAYAGNDITVVVDGDSFDSVATAFGQIVPTGLDEDLVYNIVNAYPEGEERFLTGAPRGPCTRLPVPCDSLCTDPDDPVSACGQQGRDQLRLAFRDPARR